MRDQNDEIVNNLLTIAEIQFSYFPVSVKKGLL